MSDLISRQALRETMYEEVFLKDSDYQRWDSGCWIRYKLFERVVDSMPTIDAVQVVRCKDCKVRDEERCPWWHGVPSDEFYCAWGERKDDE